MTGYIDPDDCKSHAFAINCDNLHDCVNTTPCIDCPLARPSGAPNADRIAELEGRIEELGRWYDALREKQEHQSKFNRAVIQCLRFVQDHVERDE